MKTLNMFETDAITPFVYSIDRKVQSLNTDFVILKNSCPWAEIFN